MKLTRAWLLVAAAALLLGTAPAQQSESLGDIARQQRAGKKAPKKVITNDDLPSAPAAASPAAPAAATPAPAAKAAPQKDLADEYQKSQQDFRARYLAQKQQVEKLQADIAAMQRDYQQRVAGYYADAGNRLRDDKAWADKQRKFDSDIAEKQKKLDQARQELDNIKEQARRAGIPERILED
jgi:hypothetical protein